MVAKKATQVLDWKVPSSVRNSPTKPRGSGQADIGHGEQHEDAGIERHAADEAAIGGDLAGVHAVIDHADTEEQRARHQAMADHLEHGAIDALPVSWRRCPW